ncbi:Integrin alpha8like, partial [Caligus rogercresseyi]
CNLGFLRSGDSQDYTIGFDVSNPKAYISKDFTFLLNIHPSCSRKPSPPLLQTSLTVTYDNDLYLSHHIEEPDLDYEEGIPRPFSHVYRIENKGHSPLEHNLSFLIGVPKNATPSGGVPLLSYDVSFINCEPRSADPGGKDLPKGPTLWVDGSSRVACDTEETCLTYACNLVQGAPPQTTQNLFLQFVFKMDSTEKDRTESYRIVSFAQIPSLSQTLLSGTKFDSLHRAQIKYLYEFVLPLAGGLILGVILLI